MSKKRGILMIVSIATFLILVAFVIESKAVDLTTSVIAKTVLLTPAVVLTSDCARKPINSFVDNWAARKRAILQQIEMEEREHAKEEARRCTTNVRKN